MQYFLKFSCASLLYKVHRKWPLQDQITVCIFVIIFRADAETEITCTISQFRVWTHFKKVFLLLYVPVISGTVTSFELFDFICCILIRTIKHFLMFIKSASFLCYIFCLRKVMRSLTTSFQWLTLCKIVHAVYNFAISALSIPTYCKWILNISLITIGYAASLLACINL